MNHLAYSRRGPVTKLLIALLVATVGTLGFSAHAFASIAHPTNTAEALLAAEQAPVPTAAQAAAILAESPSEITDAQRAELGAWYLHQGPAATPNTAQTVPQFSGAAPQLSMIPAVNVGNCFGPVTAPLSLDADSFDINILVNRWCAGPGNTAIVQVQGIQYPVNITWPDCYGSTVIQAAGPDRNFPYSGADPTVWHAINEVDWGLSYPWGCAAYENNATAVRFWYNGHRDWVNDWGV